ncbi:MAG: HEPN domain-containing protein [Bacteroidia bacterium]
MMTKEDYISFWKESSAMDWSSSEDLFITKHYLQSLFFAHLALEKLCKAIWVKYNANDHPPRIHNLVYILKQTEIEINDNQLDALILLNDFQLEGRYPDYKLKIYKMCDEETTQKFLIMANEIKLWLLSNLQ